MVMLGLMSSGGGQRTVPAAPGSILKRTVDFHERLTPDLDANESKTLSKRSDGSYGNPDANKPFNELTTNNS